MDDSEASAWVFLREPVPGSTTEEGPQKYWWNDWNERCRKLPAVAPKVFIEALKTKPSRIHYAAVLGLRRHGYEAMVDGYWEETTYRIRKAGETDWQVIIPAFPPIEETTP